MTSDKDAKLTVRSVKGTGRDSVTLSSENSDTQSSVVVMDVLGIEREISVQGSSVSIEVANEKEMKIKVSGDAAEVKVDGKELELSGNEAKVSFFAAKGANPMEAADMFCDLSVDKDSQLSGTAEAYVTWSAETAGDVEVITKVKDEKGNVIAEQKEKKTLNPGLQKVNVVFDKVKAELGAISGEFKAVCEMTLVDSEKNEIHISQPGITVKRENQPTQTPTPSPGGNRPNILGIVITPTPIPTVTPEETITPVPTPDVTEEPVQTEKPTPAPTKRPDVSKKNSVPKKGKVLTAGSLKYIVLKSSKKEGTVAVYGSKKENAKKVVIPKKVKLNGYSFKVTAIRQNAFAKMQKLTEVEIGKNVKKIGKRAFKNCKNLEFVMIGENVAKIETQAFAGCTKLNRILVKSDKIKSVGADAFKGITSKAIVKTSKNKWRQYCRMFMNTRKMSQNALFVINPVKLKYKDRLY